eukprot:16567-Heterococcus_DN1.PRE.2
MTVAAGQCEGDKRRYSSSTILLQSGRLATQQQQQGDALHYCDSADGRVVSLYTCTCVKCS